ncbi:MAG: hypothetical protein CVU05_14420 [Bacteroidetes bacterium HGW-Bacteroidetes-21]|nr:MAG: hypothetical protein CVU05_14420 [Bacteroidetes bacterium HGW-Bacteroidetes-21]
MLRSLYISNYVLIEHLNIDFSHGFTAITGETGAGKSVLLGAIALITGERADLSLIRNREKKCVVEAVFVLKNALPKKFFTENDLEVQPELILRRELLPGGTSRAFINDSPVNLSLMKAFGAMIIDIHSQHENLLVKDNHFQLNIIDSLAGNFALVQDYAEIFSDYQKIKSQLREAVEKDDAARKEYDYLLFQYNQIDEAGIKEGELKELETEQNILTNAGDILAHLDFCATALETGQNPLLLSVKELIQHFEQLKKHLPEAANWTERIQSIHIEMRDLLHEVEKQAATTEVSPQRLDVVNQRLDAIYSL